MTTGWVNECNGRLGGEEMKNQRPPRGEGGEEGGEHARYGARGY